MQSIKAWARANPGRVDELLNSNASYVFFRELPASGERAARRARRAAHRAAQHRGRSAPRAARRAGLHRDDVAEHARARSTGSCSRRTPAARSADRCARDFFWGYGEAAAREAGRMKQRLRMWVLLPPGTRCPRDRAIVQRALFAP